MLLVLLGLAAIGAGAAWSRWAPAWIARQIEAAAAERGVDLTVEGVAVRLDGRVGMTSVDVRVGDLRARCERVDLVVADVSERRLASTSARGCVVSSEPDSDPVELAPQAADTLVPDPAPWTDRLRTVVGHTGSLELRDVTVAAVRGVDATVDSAQLRSEGDTVYVQARVAALAPVALEGDVRAEVTADAVELGPVQRVSRDRLGAAWDAATWRAGRLSFDGLAIEHASAWVRVDELHISGEGDLPRLEATGGTIDLDRVARDLPPATPEPAPIDDERAPSMGQELATALGARQASLDAALAMARAAPVPRVDVDAGTFVVQGLGPVDVEFGALRYTPDGALSFSAGVGDVALRARTTLPELDAVTFEAQHLDLSPLSDALGGRVVIGGSFDASGSLDLATPLRFDGTWQVRAGHIEHPGISPLPLEGIDASGTVGVQSSVDAQATIDLEVDASVTVGAATAALEVALSPGANTWTLDASFSVPEPTPCQAMWDAVPAGLLPDLGHDAVLFEGAAAPRLDVTYELGAPYTFVLSAEGFPGTCEIQHVDEAWDPAQLLSETYAHAVTEGVTIDDLVVGPGGNTGWTPIDEVPGWLPALMYLSEEIAFPTNPGISVGLINRGIRLNLERGRYAYGGSTVSQQLVKNLFFTRDKTLARKLQEAVITWAMESVVPKSRILELYMNCVEFGPDIYGITAASEYYFGVPPWELTPLDAAFLATLKPSPLAGRVYLQRGHSPDHGWWPERLEELLQRLVDHGGFLRQEDVAWYAPFVAVFPVSPSADDVIWERRPRAPKPEDRAETSTTLLPRRALRRSSSPDRP